MSECEIKSLKKIMSEWNRIARAEVVSWVTKLDPNKHCCENCSHNFKRKIEGSNEKDVEIEKLKKEIEALLALNETLRGPVKFPDGPDECDASEVDIY